ncbi:hypothetical protein VDG39_17770 [Xanthomonas campestris pv. raphani]|uniref:hypothetical protein n=1 Tax=Xanthomonas campestris TaxID=339 RepID=UPI002B227649|nr:hypothetical protein [Xanthomonas campestris]MEA9914533.1 hypothetical protein [Xanthomonas campestris pv. raphani]
MQTETEKLQDWIFKQFRDGADVSKDEATSDMEVILVAFANAANVPLNAIPEQELIRLRVLFNEEWAKAVAEGHGSHAAFVKSLATKVASRAALR